MPNPDIPGFLEPWIWNLELATIQWFGLWLCNGIGSWGLFIYNDNGEMMNRCYLGFAGDKVNYEMVLTDTESSI